MNIWIDLWELFFPRCCVVCEERLARSEEFLCFKCLSALPRSNNQVNKEMEKGYTQIELRKDLFGNDRMIKAVK